MESVEYCHLVLSWGMLHLLQVVVDGSFRSAVLCERV